MVLRSLSPFCRRFIDDATGYSRYDIRSIIRNTVHKWSISFAEPRHRPRSLLERAYPDDNKLVIASSVTLFGDKKEWTKEELISQLKPMCKLFCEEARTLKKSLCSISRPQAICHNTATVS